MDLDLIVLKFGGASLDSVKKIFSVRDEIIDKKRGNRSVVVVVSAMGKMTDSLFELANLVSKNPPKRELDLLVSVGERISMTLLSMALNDHNIEAVSFTGSQSGIITTSDHCDAKIVAVKPYRIEEVLKVGKVAIVAGFQGMSEKKEVTTLGRGGSDTSAVALAAALRAKKVIFYKDVAGIFPKDPKEETNLESYPILDYKQAYEIACSAKRSVLHPRSILLAEKYAIRLHVRSIEPLVFQKTGGTMIYSDVCKNGWEDVSES